MEVDFNFYIYVFNELIEAGGPTSKQHVRDLTHVSLQEGRAVAWEIRGDLRLEIHGICDPESQCNISAGIPKYSRINLKRSRDGIEEYKKEIKKGIKTEMKVTKFSQK